MFRFIVGDDTELRLLEGRHAAELFALTDRNRAHLRPWLPWVDQTTSPADTRAFIAGTLHQLAENNGLHVGIWFRGELVGVIGFLYVKWPSRKTEIGYWLDAAAQGHGIMTRACRALIEYAFSELGLNRVEIHCAPGNTRSCAVPERLGFTQEGVLRQVEWLNVHFADNVVYGLLASEWQHRKPR